MPRENSCKVNAVGNPYEATLVLRNLPVKQV